jgi:hypothetical protein
VAPTGKQASSLSYHRQGAVAPTGKQASSLSYHRQADSSFGVGDLFAVSTVWSQDEVSVSGWKYLSNLRWEEAAVGRW